MARINAHVAIAAPSVWHTGQGCESMIPGFRSRQQCNCAAKKTAASSNAKT